MPTTTNFETFVERAGGYCPWLNDVEEANLQEDNTLDMFIDKLEEICGCKGEGCQTIFEYIWDFKNENEKLKKENEKLKKDNKQFEEKQQTWWDVFEKLRTFGMTRKDEMSQLKKENEKMKQQLETANEYCEQWGYKWDEKEEVYVNEDDGLSDSEDDE